MPLNLTLTQKRMIDWLRRHPALSRAELSEKMGITPASISVQTRTLIDAGAIREGQKIRGKNRGQPAVSLSLQDHAAHTIGCSLSPDHLAVVVMGLSGKIIHESRAENHFKTAEDAIEYTYDTWKNVCETADLPADTLVGVGTALSANFNRQTGDLAQSNSLLSWHKTDPTPLLHQKFNVPILVENDATSAAYCESLQGNQENYTSYFYVYLGMGIGGAPVLNGQIYRGSHGNAGSFGALMQWGVPRPSYRDLLDYLSQQGISPVSRADIDQLYHQTPDILTPWLTRAGAQLSELLYMATIFYDPDGFILGGTLPDSLRQALCQHIDFARIESAARAKVAQPPIQVSHYSGHFAAAIGAANLALSAICPENNH